MNTFLENLRPELLEAKLRYIHMRWGVDREMLLKLVTTDDLSGMGTFAKKRFKTRLGSLEAAFKVLGEKYGIQDRMKTDKALVQYMASIQSSLNNEQKYVMYLMGNWDEDILKVVSLAQKRYMVPERLETLAQQQPKVSFQPRPEYQNYTG
jgi:hypothetical protein